MGNTCFYTPGSNLKKKGGVQSVIFSCCQNRLDRTLLALENSLTHTFVVLYRTFLLGVTEQAGNLYYLSGIQVA